MLTALPNSTAGTARSFWCPERHTSDRFEGSNLSEKQPSRRPLTQRPANAV
jgi:hypothetical protein